MISLPLLLLAATAVFTAATVQGATGYGFVIVAAPVLTSFLAPTLAVPVLVIEGFILTLILFSRVYRTARPKRVFWLMVFGVAFTPLGAWLLANLDQGVIKVMVGVVVGVTALAMLGGFQRTAKNEHLASVPVGIVSGILMGSTGLAGPPVILFFANQSVDPREFRANIATYLLAVGVFALPTFLASGILTPDVWILSAQLLAPSIAGLFTGMWLAKHVPITVFRQLALAVVVIAAVGAIASGITAF